jgi:TPR repeat protein
MNLSPLFAGLKHRHPIPCVLSALALLCVVLVPTSGQVPAANKGQSTGKNLNEIRKSAESGNAEAQYALSEMYSKGKGVSKDQEEAAPWAQKAAEQGNVDAENSLSHMYIVGEGVPKDIKQSIFWLEKAAEQNSSDAQTNLGLVYAMDSEFAKAYRWSIIGAQNGDPVAAKNRDTLKRFVSPSQAEDAQREAREWWLAHPQYKPQVKTNQK